MRGSSDVVAILASGPSMSAQVVECVRQAGLRSIVINDTYRLMPDADALFAADVAWWQANPDAALFRGEKYVSQDDRIPAAQYVPPTPPFTGSNSALRAAQLAERQGAKTILLFGVDLRDDDLTHWHGQHEALNNPIPATFRRARAAWAEFAKTTSAEVINCNVNSGLDCFQKAEFDA